METRLVFDLKDILGVRFLCQKCGAGNIAPPGNWENIPQACSHCREQWFADAIQNQLMERFRKALEELRKTNNGKVKILLEVADPRSWGGSILRRLD